MIKFKKNWQKELINAIKTNEELISYLDIKPNKKTCNTIAKNKSTNFPILVPKSFANRIEKNNLNDPLLKQVLLTTQENLTQPNKFSTDPLQEKEFTPIPGLIHKYKSRILIINSSKCAINCRYCFRRSFPYKANQITPKSWENIIKYISNNNKINEVIFSGGDPLLMTDEQIKIRIKSLYDIQHINKIRFHTRIPIVLPERIDSDFIKLLENIKYKTIIVIHCNHPNELNHEIQEIINKIIKTGTIIYNQAVLLKGINDSADTQIKLWENLYNMGVMPYYLHLLDPVSGAAHFEVPLDMAKSIFQQIQAELPGYMIPKLTQETPNMASKTIIGSL